MNLQSRNLPSTNGVHFGTGGYEHREWGAKEAGRTDKNEPAKPECRVESTTSIFALAATITKKCEPEEGAENKPKGLNIRFVDQIHALGYDRSRIWRQGVRKPGGLTEINQQSRNVVWNQRDAFSHSVSRSPGMGFSAHDLARNLGSTARTVTVPHDHRHLASPEKLRHLAHVGGGKFVSLLLLSRHQP